MPSTDYPGQGFNAITFNNDLDDSESSQSLISVLDFESDLDDSEAGSAKDQIQRESDDPGGTGGGGNGGCNGSSLSPVNGSANTGGGGGGAGGTNQTAGANGGSGVVILRYVDTKTITIGAGLTGTESAASGGYKRATITAGTGNVSWA